MHFDISNYYACKIIDNVDIVRNKEYNKIIKEKDMYSSVLDISEKFKVSKRRVQTLCEQGRLSGAKQISGVWLIPSNIEKPRDERFSKEKYVQLSLFEKNNLKVYTLNELCKEISISYATGRNWLKLKKITPDIGENFYSQEYIHGLKNSINKSSNILKNRRNKLHQQSNSIYKEYIENIYNQNLLEAIISQKNKFNSDEIKILLANTALQMYYKSRFIKTENWNILYSDYKLKINNTFNSLLEDLLSGINKSDYYSSEFDKILKYEFEYNRNDDLFGFIYISLIMLQQRKKSGIYYTSKNLVETLRNNLKIDNSKGNKICDPCCGSGNFLLSFANSKIDFECLYGQDIDYTNITLTRLNIALLYPDIRYNSICEHFKWDNTLLNSFNLEFDFIIGNPPWGSKFDEEEIYKYQELYSTANQTNVESFNLFVEKALNMLKNNGRLSFILPESILTIGTHYEIRRIIAEKCSVEYINFLGNAFYGVQCPSIILTLKPDKKGSMKNCLVVNKDRSYKILENRLLNANGFLFNLSDEENDLIESISHLSNAVYLKDNASFALGIVTGDNKKYISNKKTPNNEVVLKGKDISRYKIKHTNNYIEFNPKKFQQVAPTEIYRAKEKLLYRFISNKPIFCYDNNQLLSLNSCNVLIPNIEGLDIKYILAILNSSVAAFYISKKFNSIKMLRSYIEQLPIPKATEDEQKEIIELVNKIMTSQNKEVIDKIYSIIDEKIFKLYLLNVQQISYIKQSI